MLFEVGSILDGKVTGITTFGAFVSLPGGKSGLVHISEVANAFVRDVHEFLTEGQEVKVKVLSITPEGRINLSIKKAQETAAPAAQRANARPQETKNVRTEKSASPTVTPRAAQVYVPEKSSDKNFEDKLMAFMQESNKKMSGSRLYENQKKGQRRRK